MEREQIAKKFAEQGILLSPRSIKLLIENANKIDFLLRKARAAGLKFLDSNQILEFLKTTKPEPFKVEIIKKFEPKKEISVADVLDALHSRYERLKEILSKRMELVNLTSIRKLTPKLKVFSLIGVIEEIDRERKKLIIEDFTGECELRVEDVSKLIEDEVIAVICERKGDEIFARELIFPDIPLRREIGFTKGEVLAVFLGSKILESTLILKNEKLQNFFKNRECVIFAFGNPRSIAEASSKLISFYDFGLRVTDPSLLSLNGLTIFFSRGRFLDEYQKNFKLSRGETVIELVKKRHLNPKLNPKNLPDEVFSLSPVPDIIAVEGEENELLNYKGLSVLVCRDMVVLNLKKRELEFLDF
jgi:DNA polymerase II small subunit/DNA polymerase delta subunit B